MFLSFTDAGSTFVFGNSYKDHFFVFRVRCNNMISSVEVSRILCRNSWILTGQTIMVLVDGHFLFYTEDPLLFYFHVLPGLKLSFVTLPIFPPTCFPALIPHVFVISVWPQHAPGFCFLPWQRVILFAPGFLFYFIVFTASFLDTAFVEVLFVTSAFSVNQNVRFCFARFCFVRFCLFWYMWG